MHNLRKRQDFYFFERGDFSIRVNRHGPLRHIGTAQRANNEFIFKAVPTMLSIVYALNFIEFHQVAAICYHILYVVTALLFKFH